MCDLYSMEYISESPNHCSKGVLQCAQNCTNIHRNKFIGHMLETNCSPIHQQLKKDACYNKQKGEMLSFPIFDNELLSSFKKN